MSKILILADAANVHTQKWATYFNDMSYEVHVSSLLPAEIKGVKVHLLKSKAYNERKNNMKYNKVAVLFDVLPQIRKLLKILKPEILHAHFASSYGLFAALSNYKPFYLSVWGYDTITFPEHSFLHKAIIKFTLYKAEKIYATSEFLAERTARYTRKEQIITPFGVDINKFKPNENPVNDKFIIGTVKALEKKYGIDYLIKAVNLIKDKMENWELWIAGRGSEKQELINLANTSGIGEKVKFLGRVEHEKIPELLQKMHIFTVTSVWECESFGVAAVEASACGIPVIASNLGGLTEVVINGKTGFHVNPRDVEDIANKIYDLYQNQSLREELGRNGRENVLAKYVWHENAQLMLDSYPL